MRTRLWSLSAGLGQRLPRRARVSPLDGGGALAGSSRGPRFIRDATQGLDCVDIVTIGDSNSIYAQGAGGTNGVATCGWTSAWVRAFHQLGAQMFASPLFPTLAGAGSGVTGTAAIAGVFAQYPTYAGSPLSNTGDTGGPTLALSGQSGAVPDALRPFCIPDTTIRPFGLVGWDAAYLPDSSADYRDFSQYVGHNGAGGLVTSGADKTFIQAGGAYAHRIFHVKLTPNSADGFMVLRVRNTTTAAELLTSANVTTHAASYQFATTASSWTATLAGNENIRGGWGYLTVAAGPCMPIFESWERPATKGFAVQNLHGHAGATSTTIASDVSTSFLLGSNWLPTYLSALNARQVACGGSGRILVHLNFGVNGGGDDFATWKASCESIMTAFRLAMTAAGLSLTNLAFVLEVTHDLDQYAVGTTKEDLVGARAGATSWAAAGHGDATVCNLAQLVPGKAMTAGGMYSAAGAANEIHLTDAGYLANRLAMLQAC
jgi:hypothetical protein